MTAVGIHRHAKMKLGKTPELPDRPRLKFADIRSNAEVAAPIVPTAVDDTTGVKYGLDRNDQFGVCVPTGFDNFRRTVTKLLTGGQVDADWAQIISWYQEQNPTFDPNAKPNGNGEVPGDNGMNIQQFLEQRVKDGSILAFASIDSDNEDQVREAVWLGLAIILGVDLQTAQQNQTDAKPPRWDYKRSGEWGGHCVVEPAYEADGDEDVITWGRRVSMSPKFISAQRDEAWFIITPEHLRHPSFREGIDIDKLAAEYERLTGDVLDLPPAPPPAPTPDPQPEPMPPVVPDAPSNDEVDEALWSLSSDWVQHHRHSGEAREVALSLRQWATAKGLLK